MSADGLVTCASAHDFGTTLRLVEEALAAKGVTVFARVDHAAGAAGTGMALRPTTVLIFGNPKGGTPLLQENQTAGIDLPLKILVWQDAEGGVLLSYNDPAWIAVRHGLHASAGPVAAMQGLLAGLASAAAAG